jgi:DNA-binding response OmpR family regulator
VSYGNLAEVVTEIGLRYKELASNDKVMFCLDVPMNELWMWFDEGIIQTILNNLLSNAVKYTPHGSITLSLRTTEDDGAERTVELLVGDTGYGIAPEALPHIFERYYQVESKYQASGTGIGLALTRALAELHEGVLRVESSEGVGTTFTLVLQTDNTYPHATHKEDKTKTQNVAPRSFAAEEADAGLPPLMLVVEDNADISRYVADSFRDDFRILVASNGKEGWEQVQQYIPDIVISDIMMPEMDGIELCRRVKEDVRTSHIPIVLLTAKDTLHDKEEGYESGADSYLTKPFTSRLLHSRVRNLLESRRRLAEQIAARTGELKPALCEREESIRLNKLDAAFLERLQRIIEENIDNDELDMKLLTEQLFMSQSTLYRKIKGLTGMTGVEFIRKLRLKNSLRLLTEEGMNVSEAAYASGFNDLAYFRNAFKEEYGELPKRYVKQR